MKYTYSDKDPLATYPAYPLLIYNTLGSIAKMLLIFTTLSCKDYFSKPINKDVLEKKNSSTYRNDVFNTALPELLELYKSRTKEYKNYEVYNRDIPFSVNWNPSLGYLFIQNDRCEWGYRFEYVDENKISAFVNKTPYFINGDDIYKEYLKVFDEIDPKTSNIYKKFINTNSCIKY
jgi:hypothetical protein